MTIEDIGLEPVFDDIDEEPKRKKIKVVTANSEEPATKETKKAKKKKPTKKEVTKENVPKSSDILPTVPVSNSEQDPPKKLNRKQTKLLKREMYRKMQEDGTLPPEKQNEKGDKKNPNSNKKGSAQKKKAAPPKKDNKKNDVDKFRALDVKYKDILDKLARVKLESEAMPIIQAEVEAGRIQEDELQTVVQRFKRMKKRMAEAEKLRKLIEFDGTLEEVKTMVNALVKKRKIKTQQAGDIITKWKTREKRRVGRKEDKLKNMTCFHCRLPGHALADCPTKDEDIGDGAEGICFKCGSLEHNIYACPKKNIRGFPFATCFVCNEEGHLSRDCQKNNRGVYPDGGCCNVCGSQKHLKKDCPELLKQMKQMKSGEEKKFVAQTMSSMTNADDEFDPTEKKAVSVDPNQRKRKIVKF